MRETIDRMSTRGWATQARPEFARSFFDGAKERSGIWILAARVEGGGRGGGTDRLGF
jgi:hypothetical protein